MKDIRLPDELYRKLASMKRPDESFSDVIERLVTTKNIKLGYFYDKLNDRKFLERLGEESPKKRKEETVKKQ